MFWYTYKYINCHIFFFVIYPVCISVIHPFEGWFEKTVPESEGRGGKLVENGGIAPVVIPLVVPITLKSQLVKIDGIPAQNSGQKFIPRDVLLNCRHNPSTFLCATHKLNLYFFSFTFLDFSPITFITFQKKLQNVLR